jgi:HSP20 family protein
MSLSRWEPFRDLMTLREAMDRLFEDSYVRSGSRWEPASSETRYALPIDAYVTAEELVITAAVPGVKPEDVDVTIEGETLTIKGQVPAPMGNVDYLARERPYGKFQRTLRLNIPVQADKAELTFDKGVLTLVIPKKEEIKPRAIKVNTR